MKRILINVINKNIKKNFNAASKARLDVEYTLKQNDYKILNIPFKKYLPKFILLPNHFFHLYKAILRIYKEKPDEIVIQYPGHSLGIKSIKFLLRYLKKFNTVLLIHDLDSLRYKGRISNQEISTLNNAKLLIVHTQAMKDYLLSNGVKTDKKILWLFDYYTKNESIPFKKNNNTNELIFAGNLSKSKFLSKLNNENLDFKLHLYGAPIEIEWSPNIKYEGYFESDDIDNLKGEWGLVWDGESLDGCNGNIGEYMKYNSSHKISLYIAMGIPIVIWSKAALAKYIVDNKLGISVDTIYQIPEKLKEVNEEKFNAIIKNVQILQRKLRKGQMLQDILLNEN